MRYANSKAVLLLVFSFSTALSAQRLPDLPTPAASNAVYFSVPPDGLRQTSLLGNGNARIIATRNDDWDTTQQVTQWRHRDSIAYVYDGSVLSRAQTLRFDGAKWVVSSRELYGYDLGNRTLVHRQTWDGTQWKDVSRTVYQYDADNHRIFTINQNSNGADWLNVSLIMYTYDANGNLSRLRRQKYLGSGWIDQNQELYTYDAAQQISEQVKQIWVAASNEWVNLQKISYQYNSRQQMEQELLRIWQNGNWEPAILNSYTYRDSLLTETIRSNWTGFVWSNYLKETYRYQPGSALLSEFTTFLWRGGAVWGYQDRTMSSYDSQNNRVYQLHQVYANGAWQNVEQSFSYYETFVSAQEQSARVAEFQISPNPGDGAFKLVYRHQAADLATTLVVSDQQGRQLRTVTLNGRPEESIDLRALPNGVYWLTLRTTQGRQGTRPLYIQR